MKTSLPAEVLARITANLTEANLAFARRYPGDPPGRQPVHTVYGGAHLFRADTAQKLGSLALRAFDHYAPDHALLASALHLPGSEATAGKDQRRRNSFHDWNAAFDDHASSPHEDRAAWIARTVHARVRDKLVREPVEDLRIDFEDGYGARPDAEEDRDAETTAHEVSKGIAARSLPPFLGIRIKPLSEELRGRGLRTLDIFLSTLLLEERASFPQNFVVTLPKITSPEQVSALVDAFEALEPALGLPPGALRLEFMIEAPQTLLGPDGALALPGLLARARGRCAAAHFGAYDYTASCNITAAHQRLTHPACDFARHLMQIAYAGTGLFLSDGATNVLPIPPHKAPPGGALGEAEQHDNRAVVHRAWKMHYDHIQHALDQGFYQGWDLHPAQLPARYAAVYAFFLDGMEAAAARLRSFVGKAAQATLSGDLFDDAATGQGLLGFFLRGIYAGAFSEEEASRATGLSLGELRTRSFVAILANRRR
jgi:citrate lyase beta subunit